MKKLFTLLGLFLLLCGVSGCGSSADSLVKEQIQNMNNLAEALENKAPDSKISELSEKYKATDQKLNDLKLSDEEKKAVMEKNKDEYGKAAIRLAKASFGKTMGDMFGKGFGGGLPGMPNPAK